MNIELYPVGGEPTQSVEHRVAQHAALADPLRLRITDLVMDSDLAALELGEALSVSSNLLAHHLGVLERAGVVERLRSEGDGRRSYVRLTPETHRMLSHRRAGSAPDSSMSGELLFICTGNSARSPFAAAWWNSSASRVSHMRATSAGTHPAPEVSAEALEAAQRFGIDLSEHAPRSLPKDSSRTHMIILCDRAYEELVPSHTDRRWQHHWSIPKPGTSDIENAYERSFCDIIERCTLLGPE